MKKGMVIMIYNKKAGGENIREGWAVLVKKIEDDGYEEKWEVRFKEDEPDTRTFERWVRK